MRRLAIFWLACAAVGFLAAVGAACVLSLAFDGSGAWRAATPMRSAAAREAAAPVNAAGAASPAMVAPALNQAAR